MCMHEKAEEQVIIVTVAKSVIGNISLHEKGRKYSLITSPDVPGRLFSLSEKGKRKQRGRGCSLSQAA